jgi:hypothetical protein
VPPHSIAFATRSLAVWAALVVLSLCCFPRSARAEPNDDAGEALVEQALKPDDFAQPAKAPKTLSKLELAKKLCDNKGCSPAVRAKVFVAIGTVKALTKKDAEAKAAFASALQENPNAALIPNRSPPEVKKLFEEAKAPAPASPTATAGKCKEEGRPPQGWKSSAAFCFFAEAVAAESVQDWAECIANADASLRAEDRPTTRYLGAQCRERGGRWTEALRDYQAVVEPAIRANMNATAEEAQKRAKALRERMPALLLRAPEGAKSLKVTIDDAPVPAERLSGEIWVDPGARKVKATGEAGGKPFRFEQVVTVAESQKKTVDITVAGGAAAAPARDPSVADCLARAKTRADAVACMPENQTASELNIKVGGEFSYYKDTDAVNVATPGVTASIEHPAGGWGVGASFLVDVVTAASVDIVSTASPSWTELRYVPSLRGHKKVGDVDLSAKAGLSVEPDYLALSGGVGLAVDLASKMVTPSLGYDFGYEISGRTGTPFSVFSHKIQVHAVTLGSTFILDKATFIVPTVTGVLMLGDTSKPYRFLPLFEPDDTIGAGETVRSVNLRRLPLRVDEQVPDERKRLAFALLFAHRFTSATIRLEERLYIDDWGLKASTTDMVLPIDFASWFRLGPHLRFHAQTGVDFWELAYRAERTTSGFKIPQLRTGDRELGPIMAGTGGLITRLGLGDDWGLTLTGDAIYTRFLDHLYVRGRLGVFAAASLETKFE